MPEVDTLLPSWHWDTCLSIVKFLATRQPNLNSFMHK